MLLYSKNAIWTTRTSIHVVQISTLSNVLHFAYSCSQQVEILPHAQKCYVTQSFEGSTLLPEYVHPFVRLTSVID